MSESQRDYWESRSYAKRWVFWTIVIIPIVIIAIFLIVLSTVGFGALAIAFIAIFCVYLILFIAFYRKLKWYSPIFTFSLTEYGLRFTTERHPESEFFNSYSNIAYFTVKNHKNGLSTVFMRFKEATDAGAFGRPKDITLNSVRNGQLLEEILLKHGVEFKKN